jgi:hypothetical protein
VSQVAAGAVLFLSFQLLFYRAHRNCPLGRPCSCACWLRHQLRADCHGRSPLRLVCLTSWCHCCCWCCCYCYCCCCCCCLQKARHLLDTMDSALAPLQTQLDAVVNINAPDLLSYAGWMANQAALRQRMDGKTSCWQSGLVWGAQPSTWQRCQRLWVAAAAVCVGIQSS